MLMTANAIIQAMYDRDVLVFGHRGAKLYAPQNTLPAFELAAAQGAHGIELDVHRSKDGFPVVIHDFTVDATTDGTGLVVEKTLAELKALDAGASFSAAFAGTRIPTLDEVFEAVGRRLYVNVEIKSVSAETDGVEDAVAGCIRRHGMERRVIVSSFNPLTLRRFRAIAPDVPLGCLDWAGAPPEVRAGMASLTYETYHPEHSMISPELIADADAAGHIVNAWTVNDAERAKLLAAMGVRGIITDAPDLILTALG
jgi:glycerophosphoryl diester phosphodiesterase